jgi:hypothetical protein
MGEEGIRGDSWITVKSVPLTRPAASSASRISDATGAASISPLITAISPFWRRPEKVVEEKKGPLA